MTKEQISLQLDGDVQLVQMWTSFLVHNRWTEQQLFDGGEHRWIVTDKGRDSMKKYSQD